MSCFKRLTRNVFTAIAGIMFCAALSVSSASATVFSFNFSDPGDGVTASGTVDVSGGFAISGSGNVTSPITGTNILTLMTFTSPGAAGFVTDDGGGVFSYRWNGGQDLIADDRVPLNGNGLLFGVGAYNLAGASSGNNPGYASGLNIWFNSENNYTAYVATDLGTHAQYNGTFTISAVPEPATWALMLIGFAGISFFAYRRTKKTAPITI